MTRLRLVLISQESLQSHHNCGQQFVKRPVINPFHGSLLVGLKGLQRRFFERQLSDTQKINRGTHKTKDSLNDRAEPVEFL